MKSSKAIGRAVALVAAAAAGMAWAHPGHGDTTTATTLFHLLTEPDHVLAILSVIGLGVAALGASSSSRSERRDRREK